MSVYSQLGFLLRPYICSLLGSTFFRYSYIYLCKDADDDDDAAFFKALEKGARVQKCGNNLSDYLW